MDDSTETLLYARKCCVVCNIAFGPTTGTKKLNCSRCQEKSGIACYCSKSCQLKHWPCHKIVCFDVKTTSIIYVQKSELDSDSLKEDCGNNKISSASASTSPSTSPSPSPSTSVSTSTSTSTPLLLVSSIKTAIDGATAGSVIIIPEGRFKASASVSKKRKKYNDNTHNYMEKETIVINKPIKILADGIGRTMLECDFHVVGNKNKHDTSPNTKSSLVIARLAIEGTIEIDIPPTEEYDNVTFLAVRAVPRMGMGIGEVTPSSSLNRYKFHIKCFPACKSIQERLLLLACEIIAGDDGLIIGRGVSQDAIILIQETEISHAKYRGIFASAYFILKNSKIHSCGSYGIGIEGDTGWSEIGDNEVQPGPWKPTQP